MKKTYFRIISTLLLSVLFIMSVGMTLAAWKINTPALNIISMGEVRGKIIEVYEKGQTVYPGSEVNKEVRVKNRGQRGCFRKSKNRKSMGRSA